MRKQTLWQLLRPLGALAPRPSPSPPPPPSPRARLPWPSPPHPTPALPPRGHPDPPPARLAPRHPALLRPRPRGLLTYRPTRARSCTTRPVRPARNVASRELGKSDARGPRWLPGFGNFGARLFFRWALG